MDGRLEISNNHAERSIKPFVIGRKNFLFTNTARGARASAMMYSLIETAKENGLNPYEYPVEVFKLAPKMELSQNLGLAAQLLPSGGQISKNVYPFEQGMNECTANS